MNLILMIGAPGSGKSTFAMDYSENNPETIYLSSDKLRAVLGESESDMSVSKETFEALYASTGYFLSLGKDVIIDATNLKERNRKGFIEMGRKYNAFIIAYIMNTHIDICKQRNSNRERKVPEYLIDSMFKTAEYPKCPEIDQAIYV